jgi:hypothetical protein
VPDSEPMPEVAAHGRSTALEVRVSLNGMEPDDVLTIALPAEFTGSTMTRLLDHAFPLLDNEQRAVAPTFDLRTNPDLPEIYEVFLNAFDDWRKGRCTLSFSGADGRDLDLSGLVSQYLDISGVAVAPEPGTQTAYPILTIQIEQRYCAVENAIQTGFWGSSEELLEWLRWSTVLYFLDKHRVEIPSPIPSGSGPGLMTAVSALLSKDLISGSPDTHTFDITEQGRGFINRLLAETESYIDLYDHFKDTDFDVDPEKIEFDTGRGVDLRVQVFMAEGLDPVRTVFLLRLYDGALDEFVGEWDCLIDEESFFDGILEPVVNRIEADEAMIGQIVDSGYGFLEEQAERARELESQQEIIDRVWA